MKKWLCERSHVNMWLYVVNKFSVEGYCVLWSLTFFETKVFHCHPPSMYLCMMYQQKWRSEGNIKSSSFILTYRHKKNKSAFDTFNSFKSIEWMCKHYTRRSTFFHALVNTHYWTFSTNIFLLHILNLHGTVLQYLHLLPGSSRTIRHIGISIYDSVI